MLKSVSPQRNACKAGNSPADDLHLRRNPARTAENGKQYKKAVTLVML